MFDGKERKVVERQESRKERNQGRDGMIVWILRANERVGKGSREEGR